MKKHEPEMERLVSLHPAQSESEKPRRCRLESQGKNKPLPGLDLRYLKTLHVAL